MPRESSIRSYALKLFRELEIQARSRHQRGYARKGDPDIYGCVRGRHFELELKTPANPKPTQLQQRRLDEWEEFGAICGVAKSRQEVRDFADRLLVES